MQVCASRSCAELPSAGNRAADIDFLFTSPKPTHISAADMISALHINAPTGLAAPPDDSRRPLSNLENSTFSTFNPNGFFLLKLNVWQLASQADFDHGHEFRCDIDTHSRRLFRPCRYGGEAQL
jgi:hypothetical protein